MTSPVDTPGAEPFPAPDESAVPVDPPRYRRDIQGLRAVAVLLVVVFHSGVGVPGGFLGVDVFFVVSGFVIGRLLVHELASTNRIGLGDFYSRRVRRILPALAVVLIFVALGSVVVLAPPSGLQDLVSKVGAAAALFSANFALLEWTESGYFDLSSEWNPLLHMWTLAVEEQFYLVFPCFVLGVARLATRGRRNPVRASTLRWVAAACALVAIASLVAGIVVGGSHDFPRGALDENQQFAFYLLPTRAWEFLAGVLVVFLERSGLRIAGRTAAALGAVGLGLIGWSGWFVTGASPTPGTVALVPVLGASVLIAAGNTTTVGVSRLLATRPVAWIGDRSDGWYLWHWPAIVFTRISFPTAPTWVLLVAGCAALVPTELSYRLVEQPIRFDRTWKGRRAVKLAVICCGTALVAFGAAAVVQHLSRNLHLPGNPEQAHLDQTVGCSRMLPDDPRLERCTWHAADSRGEVVLIGDSHAGALSEVVRDRSLAAGYDFRLVTFSACRFLAVDPSTPDSTCHRWVEAWTDELATHPKALVVVANRGAWTVHDPDAPLLDPTTGDQTTDEATKARIWQDGLTRTLDDLTRRGTPVAVVATVPEFDDFEVRTCATWRLVLAPESCSVTRSRAAVEDDRAAAVSAERAAVADVPDAHLVDFIDQLCDPDACSSTVDGVFRYRDDSHLSVPGVYTLGPAVDRDLVALARPAAASAAS